MIQEWGAQVLEPVAWVQTSAPLWYVWLLEQLLGVISCVHIFKLEMIGF